MATMEWLADRLLLQINDSYWDNFAVPERHVERPLLA